MKHAFEDKLDRLINFGLFTEQEERLKEEYFLFVDQHIKPETDYMIFLREFNRITNKKYLGDIESRKLYYELEGSYDNDERVKAVVNALTDPYIKDNIGILTPKYILKADNLAKYISYTPPSSTNNGKPKSKVKDGDYTEVQDF